MVTKRTKFKLTDCGEYCHRRRQRHDSRSEESNHYHQPGWSLTPATDQNIDCRGPQAINDASIYSAQVSYEQWSQPRNLRLSSSSRMSHVQLAKCQFCPLRNILVLKSKLSEPTHKTWPAGWVTQRSSRSSLHAQTLVSYLSVQKYSVQGKFHFQAQFYLRRRRQTRPPPCLTLHLKNLTKNTKDKYLSHWSFMLSTDRFWGSTKVARTCS